MSFVRESLPHCSPGMPPAATISFANSRALDPSAHSIFPQVSFRLSSLSSRAPPLYPAPCSRSSTSETKPTILPLPHPLKKKSAARAAHHSIRFSNALKPGPFSLCSPTGNPAHWLYASPLSHPYFFLSSFGSVQRLPSQSPTHLGTVGFICEAQLKFLYHRSDFDHRLNLYVETAPEESMVGGPPGENENRFCCYDNTAYFTNL